jgi:hypothetical protein
MGWIITPNEGVGPIRFGMKRVEVRALLPDKVSELVTSNDVVCDYFFGAELKVIYDQQLQCSRVCLTPLHRPSLMGREPLSIAYQELLAWICGLDPETVAEPHRLFSPKLNIVVEGTGFVARSPQEIVACAPGTLWESIQDDSNASNFCWTITPHEGVGPVKFGMMGKDVDAVLAGRRRRITVTLDSLSRCSGVGLDPEDHPRLFGTSFLCMPFDEIGDWLRGFDPDVRADNFRIASRTLGLILEHEVGTFGDRPDLLVVFAPSDWKSWVPEFEG